MVKPMQVSTLRYVLSLVVFAAISTFPSTGAGQVSKTSSVLDSGGTSSSGAGYTNLSAVGQPGGTFVSEGGGYYNQAGFINTFVLRPDLDADGDGRPDELEQDNDNDGLTDLSEIQGTAFNPNTVTLVNLADSDGDGVPDGAEAIAGTNPDNIDAALEIIRIAQAGANRDVRWVARGGKTYVVYARTNLLSGSFTPIATNTAVGGVAPWFVTTNSIFDASSTNVEFYAIEVLP